MSFQTVNEVRAAKAARKDRAAFYTPLGLVQMMVEAAGIHGETIALEPSAGDGRIVYALKEAGAKEVHAYEIEETMLDLINKAGGTIYGTDFLESFQDPVYDAVVMNPPFKGKEWRKHVEHAWGMVRPGGRLVAVLPGIAINLFVEGQMDLPGCDFCNVEKINKKAFKDYETSVDTILITAEKDDGFPQNKAEGFKNSLTYSVAVTLSSDRDIYNRRRSITDDEIRQVYWRYVMEAGGHCNYGVDWGEIFYYLRINIWQRVNEEEDRLAKLQHQSNGQGPSVDGDDHPDRGRRKPGGGKGRRSRAGETA